MPRRLAFAMVATAVSLTACGVTSSPAGSGDSNTTTTTRSSMPPIHPDDPIVTSAPGRSRLVTATGVVGEADVEGRGCLTMTILGQVYQLVGEVAGLRGGAEVTVTGYADPTMTTTCQVGPVFVVLSSTLA